MTNGIFWTGATSNASQGVISWTDQTIVSDAPNDLWKVNEPSGDGSCVAVISIVEGMVNYKQTVADNANVVLNGQWNDIPCTTTIDWQNRPAGAVCKMSSNPCESGWSFVNGSCYYVNN